MPKSEEDMVTKELDELDNLPETVKSAVLALSVLIDRIRSIPKADRDDLFELLQQWRTAADLEDQKSIRRAMDEILAQTPTTRTRMRLTEEKKPAKGLKVWSEYVGRKIKELRVNANWTQEQLAEKAGLPQSHISRLENAEHSATNMTLEKLAKALGVEIGTLDPCAE